MLRSCLILSFLLPLYMQPPALSECEAKSREFARLNLPLIVTNADEDRSYSSHVEADTERLHRFLDNEVTGFLYGDSPRSADDLISRLRCIQSSIPNYEAGRRQADSKMPVAYFLDREKTSVAVAYEIYRGGEGAPDIRPYLEIFQRADRGWGQSGEVGESFTQRSFYVRPMIAGLPGQK